MYSPGITLTPEQLKAAKHESGHLRVIACPGSGKTEVLAQRVANLITMGEKPAGIVAITFTEKAAEELKTRIRRNLDRLCPERSDFGDMFVGTIHAFCLYLLKEINPIYRTYDVLDDPKRVAYVSKGEIYYGIGLRSFETGARGEYYKIIERFLRSVDIMLLEDVDPEALTSEDFRKSFTRYLESLERDRYFDFPGLVYRLVKHIEKDPDSLRSVSDRLRHIIVDEYQDVDRLQKKLLDHLSKTAKSVCVVGDDDQGIYHWRGTEVSIIRDFVREYGRIYNTSEVEIGRNFRSTSAIVELSRRFIEHNSERVMKSMEHNRDLRRKYERGDIQFGMFGNEEKEMNFIFSRIKELHGTDYIDKSNNSCSIGYGDFALLVRTNEWASKIVRYLSERGIPVIATSGESIFEAPEVNLALDCIRYIFDLETYDRTSGTQKQITLKDLVLSYSEVFSPAAYPSASSEFFAEKLQEIRSDVQKIRADPKRDYLPGLGFQGIYHRVLNSFGADIFSFGDTYNYNLARLSQAISDYESVWIRLRAKEIRHFFTFLNAYGRSQYSDTQHQDSTVLDAVRVMTMHKSKGLEFPVVFIPYFIEKKDPAWSGTYVDENLYDVAKYRGNEEDARRVYYTAITRSEKYLFLTGSRNLEGRSRPRVPHHFLEELPGEFVAEAGSLVRKRTGFPARLKTEGTYNSSYSELVSFDRCPNDFLLRVVYGYNAGVPAAFGYGTNIHNVLNMIHREFIRSGRVPGDNDIRAIFETFFKMRYATDKIAERFREAAIKVVQNYVRVNGSDFGRILETEKRFEFVIGNALINGQIDLLKRIDADGNLAAVEIIDFKADRSGDSSGGDDDKIGLYDTDYQKQLRYYALACIRSLNLHPQKAVIHHLDTGKTDDVDISDGKLEETRMEIENSVRSILDRNFIPKPGKSKCDACDFKLLCPYKAGHSGVLK
jgi:DNA helicase-2/ATP-dependent DNA helicase PcrA